jgi:isocitrate dehydrogenase (NAD+)
MTKVVSIPGDGIGPSIVEATRRIIDASGAGIEWIEADAGLGAFERTGNPLPPQTVDAIREHRVALKGPLTTPVGSGFRSINVALRREFDLYINLRPTKSFAGVASRFSDVAIDLVIFRENTEGLYSGVERYVDEKRSTAESVAVVTRAGSERIIRASFEYARRQRRRKVTLVHKANILKFTSGMFLEIGREIAKEFPEIAFDDKIVDNMAMQMVINPGQFDIIVTTNLFGDILSDLESGLVGGLGLAPGANIGTGAAVFEAVHGSAPDIAGKNLANPAALLLAGTMMLRHVEMFEHADRIERALGQVIREGTSVTKDLNREHGVGTIEMADAIIECLTSQTAESKP